MGASIQKTYSISYRKLIVEMLKSLDPTVTIKEDSENSATRKGWSERSEGCDELMKFGMSSSGCETRPAKGRAASAGSEPWCSDAS